MCNKLLVIATVLGLIAGTACAQNPPATVVWSVTLPYGSEGWPARICVDQDTTYWMLSDDFDDYTISDGVFRRYDNNGLALTGTYPELPSIGCSGTLDHPIDFFVRNDSVWGIAYWQYLGGAPQDILYCAQGPGGVYIPTTDPNGDEFHDGVRSMLVSTDHRYLCAWHEVSFSQTDSRLVALDLADNVSWEITLPSPAYGPVQSAADFVDSLGVAAFPELYWLRTSDGLHTSTTQLYTGTAGQGVVLRNGSDLYWAANEAGLVHYGKLDGTGNVVWSGTAPEITVNAIAVDDLGRLWIGGNGPTDGKLIKVEANGTYTGTYTNGNTITDVDFSNGRLSWTGRLTAGDFSSYIINTIPDP